MLYSVLEYAKMEYRMKGKADMKRFFWGAVIFLFLLLVAFITYKWMTWDDAAEDNADQSLDP